MADQVDQWAGGGAVDIYGRQEDAADAAQGDVFCIPHQTPGIENLHKDEQAQGDAEKENPSF